MCQGNKQHSTILTKHAVEDTGHFAVLVDDHEVCEVPGDALRNDFLQGQTSSVVHMSIWDHRGQLLTKLYRPLQDTFIRKWV